MAEGYFNIMLPDGRNVNIMTQAGADAFISGGAPFLESNIEGAVTARQRLLPNGQQQHMSAQERRQMTDRLAQIYVMFGCVADHASPNVFAENVSRDQLEGLIEHMCDVLSKLTKNKKYIKTGALQHQYDQELLDAIIPNTKQLSFVKLALEKDLLVSLAKFCAAPREKTNLPCADITESILSIVNNCRVTLSLNGMEDETIFKKLEATGILGQALRCFTQPSPHPGALEGHLNTLDILMECSILVKKKLKPGTPTGDILADIIAGKDGYKGRRNDTIMMRLKNLQKLSSMSNAKVNSEGKKLVGKTCRNCNRASMDEAFQKSLLVCSRCKDTHYCSKECQRADWKEHKKICTPPDKQMAKTSGGMQRTIMSFTMNNYYAIMKEVDQLTQEHDVDKKELVLELDLYASANQGSAPALRDPPEFKVGMTSRYLEGTRPDEPDWFYKGTDVYENNVQQFLMGLQDHYQRMTSNHLLTIARYPSGNSGVYRVQLTSEDTGMSLFSDEALDAFRRAMRGDDSHLEQVYGEQQQLYIQGRRDMDRRNRLRQLMSEQEDGGESFMADMAALSQRINEFMESDRYRELQEGLEEAESSDDDSDDYANHGKIVD